MDQVSLFSLAVNGVYQAVASEFRGVSPLGGEGGG
jgi:hypothetical protein